jgi:hypothetical protein
MSGYCRYDDHEALLGRMAGTLGVDLEGESQSGRLTPAEIEAAVYRCMSCEEPEECRLWLEGHRGQGAEAPPPYCRNRVWLRARRRG